MVTSGNQLSSDMYREFVGLFSLPPPATSHKGMFSAEITWVGWPGWWSDIISSIRYPEIADPLVQGLSSASCSQTWAISSWIMAEEIRGFWIPYEEDLALWKLKKAMKTEIVLDIQDSQLRETVWSFSPKHNLRSTKIHYSSFPLEDGGSEEFLKMQVRGRTWWPTWKASLLPSAYVQWASSNFTIWNVPILVWLSCTLNLMVV